MIRAIREARKRQAGSAPGAPALEHMENDPYGFASTLERDAVKVMHKDRLAAFERQVRARFETKDAAAQASDSAHRRDPTSMRRRWGEVLRAVYARRERAAWHAKAMDAAERADLGALIELWLETREIERLVKRLRTATDAELEELSHYQTEPAARRPGRSHPDVAARVYRAPGMRILNARKSAASRLMIATRREVLADE